MGVRNIDLTKPNPTQPVDLQAQQALLAQQAAIAEALIAQSMERSSPIIHTGGGNQFARDIPNIGDPVAKVVQAMIGRRKLEEATAGQGELNAETDRRTRAELDAISRRQFGAPEPPTTPFDDEGNQMPPVQGRPDYIGAYRMAQQSTTPQARLRAAELGKGMISPEEGFKMADKLDIPSIAAAMGSQDVGRLRPKIELREHEGVVRPFQADVGPVGPAAPITTYGAAQKNALGIPVQPNVDTGKEQSFGQFGDVSTQKHFETKGIDTQMKVIEDGAKDYVLAGNNKAIIEQVREDMKSVPEDAFGFLGGFKTSLGKAAEAFGFDKLPETASKEAIRSALGNLTLQKVRALAPVTELDLKAIEQIVGSENNTKRALVRILDYMDQVTDREMKLHIGRVKTFSKRAGDPDKAAQFYNEWVPEFQTGPTIKAPGGGDSYKGMSDDDLLKRLRGG